MILKKSGTFHKVWTGTFKLITAGSYTHESGAQAVEFGQADYIAYGRHSISNAAAVTRLSQYAPLTPENRATFYFMTLPLKGTLISHSWRRLFGARRMLIRSKSSFSLQNKSNYYFLKIL